MKLRQRLGKWLIQLGIRLAGKSAVSKTDVKQATGQPTDAVVEAVTKADIWQPDQHGNVVIAEPDIMRQFRRDRDQM